MREGDAMREAETKTLVRGIVESTPGMPIAVIGLSLALYASESARMSSFQSVQSGSLATAVPSIVAIAVLGAIVLAYRARPMFRLHRHMAAGLVVAGLLAASVLFVTGMATIPQFEALMFLTRCVRRTCELLLMLCWAEVLIPLGARKTAVAFALALLSLGCLNALSTLFKEGSMYTLLALVPLLSIACLYWFKDRTRSIDYYRPDDDADPRAQFAIDRSLMSGSVSRASMTLVFLLPLACYSFVFGNVHFSWVPNQDGSITSLSIQLAAAAGTVLAGLLLLVLVARFWGRRRLELYNLFMLPLLVLTLYLTDLLGGSLSFLYVAQLNVVQKLVLFLMWVMPFLVPSERSPMAVWGCALALYQTGKALSTATSGISDTELYTIAAIGVVMALIVANIVGIMLDRGGQYAPDPGVSQPGEIPQDDPPKPPDADLYDDLARQYRLTRREKEILRLLAEGMTAGAIAETLVVSTSTAKSHMRNIYAKLDVHTQSELVLLVHRRQG